MTSVCDTLSQLIGTIYASLMKNILDTERAYRVTCLHKTFPNFWNVMYILRPNVLKVIQLHSEPSVIEVLWWTSIIWWRNYMESLSAWLAIYEGNPSVTGRFPSQRPLTRSLNVFLICAWTKCFKQTIEPPVIWDAITLIVTSPLCKQSWWSTDLFCIYGLNLVCFKLSHKFIAKYARCSMYLGFVI